MSLTLEAPHGAASPGQRAGTATCALALSCARVEWRSLLGAEGDGEKQAFPDQHDQAVAVVMGQGWKEGGLVGPDTGGCEKTAGSPSQRGREARAGRTVRELRL